MEGTGSPHLPPPGRFATLLPQRGKMNSSAPAGGGRPAKAGQVGASGAGRLARFLAHPLRREPSLNPTARRSPDRTGLSRTTLARRRDAAARRAVLDCPVLSGTLACVGLKDEQDAGRRVCGKKPRRTSDPSRTSSKSVGLSDLGHYRMQRMSAFRKTFGIACFIFVAVAILSFFKIISLNITIIIAGLFTITAISIIIDALVARNENTASNQRRAED